MRPLACLAVLLAVGAVHAGENWERFRGPNGSGTSDDKNVPVKFGDENILWKVAVPGVGHSSPVVWGPSVFLQSASADGKQRVLLCLDAETGKTRWQRFLPGTPAPKHALNSLASATPATDGQAVYASVWDGQHVHLVAFSVKGEPLWDRDLGAWVSEHGPGSSPIVYKDKLIFAFDMDKEDGRKQPTPRPSVLLALDKKTGATVWEMPREPYRASYSAPFLAERDGKTELVVTSTMAITSYNPDTGEQYWNWPWIHVSKRPLRTIASSLLVGDTLVSCAGDGGGDRHALALTLHGAGKKTTLTKAWENRKELPYVPTALARGDYLYFVNDSGYAGCYEATTGKRAWYERLPDAKFSASPVMVGDKIYAGSEQGDVFVLTAEPTFRLLAKNSLGELIRATPALAHDRLYVRGQEHLFCIGKK